MASILAFLNSIPAFQKILEILNAWFKQLMPTTEQKIEDDKKKLRDEIANSDQTGRP